MDSSRDADEALQIAKLHAALGALSDEDLVTFVRLFWGVRGELHLHRLWAAACLMNGGCSDDGFTDFRTWLISR